MTRAHRTASVLVGIGLIYWVGFGGTFGGALSWRHQFLGHLALFLVFLWAGWKSLRNQAPLELRRLPTALNVALGLIVVDKSWRAIAGQSWNSTEDLATSVSLLILFYVLLQALDDPAVLAVGCVFATTVCCVAGLILAYLQHRELALPLGSRVLMAGLLILVAPIAWLGARQSDGSRLRKILWLTGGLIVVIGIVQTRSLAAIAILPVILLWSAAAALKPGRKIAVGGAFVATILVCTYWLASVRLANDGEPLGRLRSLVGQGEDSSSSLENRLRYWSGAIPAIKQKQLWGWGAGAVGIVYPRFRIQTPGYAPPGEVVADLHSVPMTWLFEFGVVGLALRLATLAAFLALGFSRRTQLQKAGVIGLTGYALFCLMHYNLSNPATYLVATLVAIMAASPQKDPLKLSPRASDAACLLLIGCAVVIFSYQLRLDYANRLLARSSAEPERTAVSSAIRASLLDSRAGFYDAVAALRIDRLLLSTGKKGPDASFLFASADRHYRQSLQGTPWQMQIEAARGHFLLREGRVCDALDPLERAASLDFYFSLSHFDLANAYTSCLPAAQEQRVTETAIALMTTPATAYTTQWRTNEAFLGQALDQSLRWLDSWNGASASIETGKLNRLRDFLRAVRGNRLKGRRQVTFALAEGVAGDLISDPFAYIVQRRTPAFESTRIEVDGLDSGTWSPEGIGRIKGLRSLTFDEVQSAYKTRTLDQLMRTLVVR